MQLRDEKGRFIASGESNPFNRKWVRRDKIQANTTISQSDLDDAFLDGYERGVAMGKYKSISALKAWKESINP